MSALSRRGMLGSAVALLPVTAAAAAAPAMVAPTPDAAFLAHLATFAAAQKEAESIVSLYPWNDTPPDVQATLDVLWDRQRAATDAMVALGCATWPVRQRLAEVLRVMGHREAADKPDTCDEDRLESLLLRSMFGGIGEAA